MSATAAYFPALLHKIGSADSFQLRFYALSAAVILYAAFGSPTPNHPGLNEILVGFFLVLACVGGAAGIFRRRGTLPLWHVAGRALFIYGLSIVLLKGVVSGHDTLLMIRDVIPFLFFLLPLFAADIFKAHRKLLRPLIVLVMFSGSIFAVRVLLDFYQFTIPQSAEPYYLANAPTVLFTLLFSTGQALRHFSRLQKHGNFFAVFCFFALAMICLVPLALTLQRAPIGFFVLYTGLLLLLLIARKPHLGLSLMATLCLFSFLTYEEIAVTVEMLMQKTALVGVNSRGAELSAVWLELAPSWLDVAFGSGWGGTFESPAVAEIRVNYTHGLLSSILLKTGICGLILCGLYLWGLSRAFWPFLQRNFILGGALVGPFLIDIFLYASFKSLDFGLILLLIGVCAPIRPARAVASPPKLLYLKD